MIKQCFILTTLLISALFLTTVRADQQLLNDKEVQAFIKDMVVHDNFSQSELENIFRQVRPLPEVVQKMKNPVEANPWDTYKRLFITERRVNDGSEFLAKHVAVLKQAENSYGVSAKTIVAILGVESSYGTYVMKYRAIDALAHLAFHYPSRKTFFQSQLRSFLILVRSHHLNINEIRGSYAGAIGPAQFMPESILKYAVISRTDLNLNSAEDWINSIGNYFNKKGWEKGKPVAIQIACPKVIPDTIVANSMKNFYSPEQLRDAGIANNATEEAMFVVLKSSKGSECWLGYHNFAVIMRYNTSPLYAMAVYQLSQQFTSPAGIS